MIGYLRTVPWEEEKEEALTRSAVVAAAAATAQHRADTAEIQKFVRRCDANPATTEEIIRQFQLKNAWAEVETVGSEENPCGITLQ